MVEVSVLYTQEDQLGYAVLSMDQIWRLTIQPTVEKKKQEEVVGQGETSGDSSSDSKSDHETRQSFRTAVGESVYERNAVR